MFRTTWIIASQAGISNDQLSMALEPEAATIWCKQLESLKKSEPGSSSTEMFFKPGMSYMVVDLGGGTVDIAVHEIKHDGSLGELYKASGGPWGGTCVDKNFLTFIGKIVGQDVLQTFMKKHTSDYIDLLREFETKKRTIKSGMDTKITITLPISIKDIFDKKKGNVKKTIKHSGNEGKVSWDRDKFRFDASLGVSFFDEPIQRTLDHVSMLLSDPSLYNVSTMLLVGGFAECKLVQESFRKHFKQTRIIILEESGLVILKGATISGHIARAITTRIARFTYGVSLYVPFDPVVHPKGKMISIDGKNYCKEIFDKYVEIGETLNVGHTVTHTRVPLKLDQTMVEFHLFASTEKYLEFTTDSSCHLLGKLVVPVPQVGKKLGDRDIELSTIFGDTEIIFKAKQMYTGKEFRTYFKYD